jgi:ABC-type glycerol-3-phosphate transport system substrate-binding protein
MQVRSRLIAALAIVLGAIGCGGKYDTPEACFQTIRMAAHKEDITTFYESLTPESQDVIVGALLATAAKARVEHAVNPDEPQAKQQVEAFNPVLSKHEVDEQVVQGFLPQYFLRGTQAIPELAKAVKAKLPFVMDMYAAMKTADGNFELAEEFYKQLAGQLREVTIEGDEATAIDVTESGETPLNFRRSADGWKLHIDLATLTPQA